MFGQPLQLLPTLLYLVPAGVCMAFAILSYIRVAPAMKPAAS
jgi:hypothetical protein